MKAFIKCGCYCAAFLLVAGSIGHFDTMPTAPISDAIGPLTASALLATAGVLIDAPIIEKRDDVGAQQMRRYPVNPYDQYRRI